MEHSDFRVAVIIPVYNAARWVQRAVESALALPEVEEVILVEDGSPDDALEVCEELSQLDRVRLLRHADGRNHGAGASRNLGARNASSPFIAFLDADDWYLANRFSRDKEILLADSRVDGVYNAIARSFESEALRDAWHEQGRKDITTLSAAVPPEELIDVLMWSHPIVTGEFSTIAVTVRAEFFRRIGGFFEPLLLQQDTHLWKRMAAVGRLSAGNISEAVAVADVHGHNRMTKADEQERFRDLWWESLGHAFHELGVSPRIMQLWRKEYSAFRASRPSKVKASAALGNWLVHQPSELATRYGHFDVTLRRIFTGRGVARFLSLKNRLLGRTGA
jgi:hypothetical protein